MSDNGEADTEEPAVPLGEGTPVEGAPTARVAARLHYPIEESEVLRREGDTTIRTPDGPRGLADVLAESDEVYFPDRQSFVGTVQGVVGNGPIPTEGDDGATGGDGATSEDETADADVEDAEPDNAAEAPQGEVEGSPDEDNAAEAAEDQGRDGEPTAETDEESSADDEAPADEDEDEDEDEGEGEFEFNDPEE